jgi:hypothetical protein
MGDTQNAASEAQEAQQSAEQTAEQSQSTESENDAQETAEGSGESKTDQEQDAGDDGSDALGELPEWARKEIEDLRKENASKRVKNNELSQQLQDILSSGDPKEQAQLIEQLQAQVRANELKATKAELARRHNIPDAATALLTAEDPEALEAQVLAIAALTQGREVPPAPQPDPVRPAGGRDPYSPPAPQSSELLAAARSRRNR